MTTVWKLPKPIQICMGLDSLQTVVMTLEY